MEEGVPWGLVRRYWRTKRTGWRRALRVAEGPADLVARLRVRRRVQAACPSAQGSAAAGNLLSLRASCPWCSSRDSLLHVGPVWT